MRQSRLPSGGANIFQTIRAKRADAEARGLALLDLSIGEPKGPALLECSACCTNRHHERFRGDARLSVQRQSWGSRFFRTIRQGPRS